MLKLNGCVLYTQCGATATLEFEGNLRGSGTIYVIYFELFLLESSNQTLYIESVIQTVHIWGFRIKFFFSILSLQDKPELPEKTRSHRESLHCASCPMTFWCFTPWWRALVQSKGLREWLPRRGGAQLYRNNRLKRVCQQLPLLSFWTQASVNFSCKRCTIAASMGGSFNIIIVSSTSFLPKFSCGSFVTALHTFLTSLVSRQRPSFMVCLTSLLMWAFTVSWLQFFLLIHSCCQQDDK